MNDLQRHIETLLLDNDCVIVPNFGGFVTYSECARYETKDNVFLPPYRTLGFNPLLRMNDSLLVQSYCTAYDISYPEAISRIENEVNEIKEVIHEHGEYTLDNIGTLTVDGEGNYQFAPCEAGVLTPSLYGLSSFEMLTLKDSAAKGRRVAAMNAASRQTETTTSMHAENMPALIEFAGEDNNSERSIEIKLSWIRNSIAVAAAVLAFFLMTTPIANSNLESASMSRLQNSLNKMIPQDTNVIPATPISEMAESTESTESASTETEIQTATYLIVLASQVKMSNAEYFVEMLKKKGYEDARVFVRKHIVRVVYGNYGSESDARNALNRLNDDADFAQAWIYKVPDEV